MTPKNNSSQIHRPARSWRPWAVGASVVTSLVAIGAGVMLLMHHPLASCSADDLSASALTAPSKTGIFTSYGVSFENHGQAACGTKRIYSLRAVGAHGQHSLPAMLPPDNQPKVIKPGQKIGLPLSIRDTTSLDAASCRPFEATAIELSFDNHTTMRWPLRFSACRGTASLYAGSVLLIPAR